MSIKQKSIHLFINQVFSTASQFGILILASYLMSVNEYGTYRQFLLLFETMSPILGLGLANSIFYFLPESNNHFKLLNSFIKIIGFTFVVFQILLIGGFDKIVSNYLNNGRLDSLLFLLPSYIAFNLLSPILQAVLIHNNQTKRLLILNIVGSISFILVAGLLVLYNPSTEHILYSRILILFIINAILYYFISRSTFTHSSEIVKTTILKIIRYSAPIGLATIVGVLSVQFTKFIVSSRFSVADFAIYSNGAIEIPFLGLITSTLTLVSLSEFSKMCKQNDFAGALTLFHKIAFVSAMLIIPAGVYFFIFAKEFIILLFGKSYEPSFPIFQILLFLVPVRIIVYGPILIALGKSKVLLFRSIIELFLNIILSFVLLHYFGFYGIAFANVLSILLWTVPYNLFTIHRGLGCGWKELLPYKKLLSIFVISLGSALPVLLIKSILNDLCIIFVLLLGIIYILLILMLYNMMHIIKVGDIVRNLIKG